MKKKICLILCLLLVSSVFANTNIYYDFANTNIYYDNYPFIKTYNVGFNDRINIFKLYLDERCVEIICFDETLNYIEYATEYKDQYFRIAIFIGDNTECVTFAINYNFNDDEEEKKDFEETVIMNLLDYYTFFHDLRTRKI